MRQNNRKVLWIALFAGLLLCFVAIPTALVATQPPRLDNQNCRQDGEVPAHAVVLIDQSDPFAEADVQWVWQLIFDQAKGLAKYGRLTVLGINSQNPDEGVQAFSRCSPGSPSQANPLYENPRFISEDWDKKFQLQMKADVSKLMLNKQAPSSPIAEHIRGILRRVDFQKKVHTRSILIISDLEQNSAGFSNLKKGTAVEPFVAYLKEMEFPDLDGVKFQIFRIERKGPLKGDALQKFWQGALASYHAQEVSFVRE